MLVIFPTHDKIVNTETIDYVDVVGRTDKYAEDHVIIKFDGGNFLEFPPEVSLHEVYTKLNKPAGSGTTLYRKLGD